MTDAATLIALAERVEGHSETENKLNEEIAFASGWRLCNRRWFDKETVVGLRNIGASLSDNMHLGRWELPDFLSSVDAAMSIIPNGWTRSVDATAPELGIDVDLYSPHSKGTAEFQRGSSMIEACAITSAALRARAKEMG